MLLFHPTIFTYPPSDNRDSYRFSLLLRLIYPLHQAGEPDAGVHDNSFLKLNNRILNTFPPCFPSASSAFAPFGGFFSM
jgi:hypothetical protein